MKIKQAHIVGFGQWRDQTFDFVTQLQIIQGLNESGKTTLHQFLLGMLFGFPQAKGRRINTYEPLEQGPYGGTITFDVAGTDYELTRLGRTQTTVTLRTVATGQQFADAEQTLAELLGPVDRDLYLAVFSFDQEALAQIFALRPDEFAEHLRTLATPGSEQWLALANRWDKEATNEFGATKTAHRPINEALTALANQRMDLQATIANRPSVNKLESAYEATRQQVATLTERQSRLTADASEQAARQQLVPVYQRWQQLQQQLAHADEPLDTALADGADRLEAQLRVMPDVPTTTTVTQEQLNQTRVALDEFATLQQQQRQAATQQAQFQDERDSLLQTHHWQAVPAELTPFQVKALQTGTGTAVAAQYRRAGIGALAFGVILLIGLAIAGQLLAGIVLFILLAGAGHVLYRVMPKRVAPDVTLPAGYEGMTNEQIITAQPDVQRLHGLIARIQELMTMQQTVMPDMQRAEERLNWLGYHLTESEYRQRLADEQAQMTTAGQQAVTRAQYQQRLLEIYQALDVAGAAALQARRQEQQAILAKQQEADLLREQLGDADLTVLAAASESVDDVAPSALAMRLQTELADAQQQLARLDVQRQRLATDTTIEAQQQALANQEATVITDLQTYFTNRLASAWVNRVFNLAIGDRLPQLLSSASALLARLTQGNYTQISQTKTLIKVTRQDGVMFTVTQLSKGTAEQVYVAMRLAFVKLVAPTLALPIMIDDAFVDFDTPRQETMLQVLAEMATDEQQILYFTARRTTGHHILDLNELKGDK